MATSWLGLAHHGWKTKYQKISINVNMSRVFSSPPRSFYALEGPFYPQNGRSKPQKQLFFMSFLWVIRYLSWSDPNFANLIYPVSCKFCNFFPARLGDDLARFLVRDRHVQILSAAADFIQVVGKGGIVIKSVNADSFKIVDVGTDLPLNDVYFSDQNMD